MKPVCSGSSDRRAEVQSDMQRAIDMGFVCSVCLSIFCEVSNHHPLPYHLPESGGCNSRSVNQTLTWACAWCGGQL